MRTRLATFALVTLLVACSTPSLTTYKMDVQQGNSITQDMVDKLKPGMTKSQVRFVLGSPLIVDSFHTDRWDYVYRLEKRGQLIESRKITVMFENELLKRIDGDVVPAAPGQSRPAAAVPTPDAAKEEKGFFGKMLEKIGL